MYDNGERDGLSRANTLTDLTLAWFESINLFAKGELSATSLTDRCKDVGAESGFRLACGIPSIFD